MHSFGTKNNPFFTELTLLDKSGYTEKKGKSTVSFHSYASEAVVGDLSKVYRVLENLGTKHRQ